MPQQTILQKGAGADLFVYFHIAAPYIKDQAKAVTDDTVVVELWGNGTAAYRSVIAGYGGWSKYISDLAAKAGRKSFAHTCVTTWSAGSEVLRTICRGAQTPDAIVSLDGIYGSKPPGSKPGDGNVIFDAGAEAIAQYAMAAARGEKVFVLLHSSIPTRYGSSGEMAARIQRAVEEELGQQMQADETITAAELDGHQFREALVLGNFHLLEFAGSGAKEHVREAHLFDEVWRRWIPWTADGTAPPTDPAPAPDSTLRRGSDGDDVRAWQLFLIGRGEGLVADGDFGPKTEAATKRFQTQRRLGETGIVDDATLDEAKELGFGQAPGGAQHPIEAHGPEWPPKPGFGPLVGNQARAAVFGAFTYEPAPHPANPEGIRILNGWTEANIVTVELPQLRGIVGAPASCRVQLHRLAAARVRELFERWGREGLLGHIRTWGGSWVPRFVRGSRTTLSNHAFGTAFDINAPWNGLGAVPALAGRTGSVRELVPIANELGFFWGGHFASRPDGMHFELAKL